MTSCTTSARQVGREVRDLVGLQGLGRRHELPRLHGGDERLAHGVRQLEQDLALALGLDEVPDRLPLLERQRLQDVGDVGRMQPVQFGVQVGQGRRALGPLREALLDPPQVLLQVLDLEAGRHFGHGICALGMRARIVSIRPAT